MNTAALIRSLSTPLEPVPTGTEPHLPPLQGVRGVVFDVYGTLVISGSGDISLAQEGDREETMRRTLQEEGVQPGTIDRRLSDLFHETIRSHQDARREDGIGHPEVEIREVWKQFLATLQHHDLGDEFVSRLAVVYECRVNPVWPMPGCLETLETLGAHGLLLGIVSNAQFFTPLLFDALLEKNLTDLMFNYHCCVWSYLELEAKPSVRLYELLRQRLGPLGIEPGEILYVGNDMRNDIWPAQNAGFRTALFAGDQRSLRLREDAEDLEGIRPDAILTELRQIPILLGLPPQPEP